MKEISLRPCADMIGINHCALHRFENGEDISGPILAQILSWALGNQPIAVNRKVKRG